MTHACRACGEQFEPTTAAVRRRNWICKACRTVEGRTYRAANPEKGKAQKRAYNATSRGKAVKRKASTKYNATPEGRAVNRRSEARYRATPAGKATNRRSVAKHSAKYPDRYAAHRAVSSAIRSGKLVPQPCQNCPSTEPAQAHHEDYSKPLAITWLCRKCHDKLHRYKRNEQHDVELALAAW